MRIGGLDPSLTSTGFALHTGDTLTLKFSAKFRPPGQAADDWKRYRVGLIRAEVISQFWMCDFVVIESFSYGSTQGREILGHLGHGIRQTLTDIGVPFLDIAPTTLKKFATGKGNASKDDMKQAAKTLKLRPKATHDEVDAAFLRELGRHVAGESTRFPPSTHTDHLSKITLPKGVER